MKQKHPKWRIGRPPLAPRFQLPSKDDLFNVVSGDHVKLIFEVEGANAERMWVRLEQCGDMAEWTGRLDNDPAQEEIARFLKPGMLIRFHPYDVIDIDSDIDDGDLSQIIDQAVKERINSLTNTVAWYKNPNLIIPAIIGLLGVAATIIAALV
jgi:hypothetical protein